MIEHWTFEAVHRLLVARQPFKELARKANKAYRKKQKMWTQEEIDCAEREALHWGSRLRW